MSKKHPIIAVTGSSGAGTTNVKVAFEHIFRREGIKPAMIEGDSFHRYDRNEMQIRVEKAKAEGRNLTHFGPEGNLFEELEDCFRLYSETGEGKQRYYIHNPDEAQRHHQLPGSITSWQSIPAKTDLMFYEGLHGGVITDKHNIAQYVDLLIGVVPIVNLEWIQKIHRDRAIRGYSIQEATDLILRRMHDYAHYIIPQFSYTHINFQRVPTIDTSNPFAARDIPTNDQSFTIIHFKNPKQLQIDFRYLLEVLGGSFMSAPDTLVVPSGKKIFAMEIIINPIVERMMAENNAQ